MQEPPTARSRFVTVRGGQICPGASEGLHAGEATHDSYVRTNEPTALFAPMRGAVGIPSRPRGVDIEPLARAAPDDLILIATHESGHAFMACALHLPLACVQLDPPRYDLAPTLDVRDPASRLNRIRILAAGGEAEIVIFGHATGDDGDRKQIADLLRPENDESALRDEVRRLLGLNAGTLRYLAARLGRRGRLTGDEVEALVRGAKMPLRARKSPPWWRGGELGDVRIRRKKTGGR